MYQQNQIPRKLTSESGLEQLQSIVVTRSFGNRTELTHAACEEFGFYDAPSKGAWNGTGGGIGAGCAGPSGSG